MTLSSNTNRERGRQIIILTVTDNCFNEICKDHTHTHTHTHAIIERQYQQIMHKEFVLVIIWNLVFRKQWTTIKIESICHDLCLKHNT